MRASKVTDSHLGFRLDSAQGAPGPQAGEGLQLPVSQGAAQGDLSSGATRSCRNS